MSRVLLRAAEARSFWEPLGDHVGHASQLRPPPTAPRREEAGASSHQLSSITVEGYLGVGER